MRSRLALTRVRWVMGVILVLFVASALVAIAAVAIQGSRNADAAAEEILDRIGDRTADLIAGQLQPAVVALSQMALAMDDATIAGSDPTLEYMLATQLRTMDELSGAFIGFPDGSFQFVRADDDGLVLKRITVDDQGERLVVEGPLDTRLRAEGLVTIDDDFDPRVRPWYAEATEQPGEIIWTAPYVFFASQRPGVTAAVSVPDDDGGVRAVIGIDITLSNLSQSVDNLPIDATAEAFIVADDRVIAAPSGQAVITTNTTNGMALVAAADLGLDAIADGPVSTTVLERDGLPAWSIVVRTGHIEFIDTVREQTRNTLAAVAIAIALALTVLITVGVRVRRPLNELTTLAGRDPLTDVPNRRAVIEFGEAALANAADDDKPLTVAMLDIDFFKAVNDDHGHAVGDDALRRVGAGLARSVRPSDLVGRYGGDEFVVILVGTDAEGARDALARIKQAAERELQSSESTERCTVSVGQSSRRGRDVDILTLIAEADAELLSAKASRTPRRVRPPALTAGPDAPYG